MAAAHFPTGEKQTIDHWDKLIGRIEKLEKQMNQTKRK